MSDTPREQRPLLREDLSDDEFQQVFSPPPRRPMGYRGKAKNTVKGAGAIIKHWPDYWSSSVTYWWIGVGMFALMTILLYNSLVVYSLLPVADTTPISQHIKQENLNLPEMYMHVLVNNEKEADVEKFLPYVEIFADKYLHYKFNLIIILNDTVEYEKAKHQAQINNEDAMNSLWSENHVHELEKVPRASKSNIIIKYVNLSNYMAVSPLRQIWKQLPYKLIEFLVRAVSIWDKGGIAFNPIILTPRSPDAIYVEKLYNLLSLYEKPNKLNVTAQDIETHKVLFNHKRKYKKKVNNIRDVIDALETDNSGYQNTPEALSEAENRLSKLVIQPLDVNTFSPTDKMGDKFRNESENIITNVNLVQSNRSEILNYMLPSFMDFLFHDKSNKSSHEVDSADINTMKRNSRSVPTESRQEAENLIKPMILSAPENYEKTPKLIGETLTNADDVENLTIDLKGNIIATRSPCHAFLGSMFSNVKHRTEDDSLKDFIIAELSLFCNGLLSTCKGMDVILL